MEAKKFDTEDHASEAEEKEKLHDVLIAISIVAKLIAEKYA